MIAKLLNALRNPASLGDRAIGAGFWSMAGMGVQYPLRLAGNLIMTRILAPEDFGLMATILTLHMGLGLLSDVGIAQSVARDPKGDTPSYLRTAWSVQIVRGLAIAGCLLVLGALIMILGPFLAAPNTVYADPRLPGLVWASTLVFVATGFQSANFMLAGRRMQIKRNVALEIVAQFATLTVMIVLGLVLENVWALMIGAVAGGFTKTLLTHLILPGPRMQWAWDRTQVQEMWQFGKWLIGSSLGGFLITHGDRLVLSALLDKTLFGIYAIAILWIEAGGQVLNRIAGSIFVPSFGQVLNTRPQDIGSVLRKAFRYYSLTAFVLAIGTLAGSVLIITYLYDPRYALAVPMVIVLAFRNLILRYNVLRQFVTTTGDTRHNAITSFIGGALAIFCTYTAFTIFGFETAIAVAALSAIPMYVGTLLQRDVQKHIAWHRELLFMGLIACACIAVATLLGPAGPSVHIWTP